MPSKTVIQSELREARQEARALVEELSNMVCPLDLNQSVGYCAFRSHIGCSTCALLSKHKMPSDHDW